MRQGPGRLVLLGRPVAHSLSPVFQNAALARAGIPLRYEALEVQPDELRRTLGALREVRGAGNATIPHKQAVAACCNRLTPVAELTGAVNTFWHEGDVLVGDNTDVVGFRRLVESLRLAQLPRAIGLLGAGGAAAAVCEAARGWPGARVRLWGRRVDAARHLAARYADVVHVTESPLDAVAGADLVVNATPVGLTDDAMVIPVKRLPCDAAVTDLVYRRGESRWVREARAQGHAAADGLVMLVEQGAESFRRWLGVEPDRDAMWQAIRDHER